MKNFILYLWGHVRNERTKVASLISLAGIAAILDTLGPLTMGKTFDIAATEKTAVLWGSGILAWLIFRLSAERMRTYIAAEGGSLGNKIGQKELAHHAELLLTKPLPFHHSTKTHEINNTLSNLRWETSNFMQGGVFDLLPALLTGSATIIYISFIDARIGAVIAIGMSIFLAYTLRITPAWMKSRSEWIEKAMEASSPGFEALGNILIIKSTTNEARVSEKLTSGLETFLVAEQQLKRQDRSIQNTQNMIMTLTTLSVLVICAHNLSIGRFSLGTLTAITTYTMTALGYVRYAQWTYRSLIEGSTKYAKMKVLLDIPSEDYANGRIETLKGKIRFDHVMFRYLDEKPVLEDVSFYTEPGEKIAIVGESGEGKSTIVELLGRYYSPKRGTISIDGLDIESLNLRSLRSQMAYVPQDLSLLHETIEENIRFGRPNATFEEVQEAARNARLHDFIEGLPEKYKTTVGERGHKLSGGQRQRIALARAFLRNPQILILDEPTSNLDSKTEQSIQEALELLMRGKTTLIIAHRLRTVLEADKILVLKDGAIVESGKHAELRAMHGVYDEMCRAQEQNLPTENT